MRPGLNYANVTSTLALIIAVGTGGAWAAGQLGSDDILNNSVKSADLKNHRAVNGRDVVRNGLNGSVIDEKSLVGTQIVKVAGDEEGPCDPVQGSFVDCASASVALHDGGRLLAMATGGFVNESGGPASVVCQLRVDGNDVSDFTPGEAVSDNTSTTATQGFSRTLVTDALSPGQHEVALACEQPTAGDDVWVYEATVAVLALKSG